MQYHPLWNERITVRNMLMKHLKATFHALTRVRTEKFKSL